MPIEPKYHGIITLTSQPGQPAPDSYAELRGPWGAVRIHDPHTWGDVGEGFAREKIQRAAIEDAAKHGLHLTKPEIEVTIQRNRSKKP